MVNSLYSVLVEEIGNEWELLPMTSISNTDVEGRIKCNLYIRRISDGRIGYNGFITPPYTDENSIREFVQAQVTNAKATKKPVIVTFHTYFALS